MRIRSNSGNKKRFAVQCCGIAALKGGVFVSFLLGRYLVAPSAMGKVLLSRLVEMPRISRRDGAEATSVTDEMFFNTYYNLLHSLDIDKFATKITRQDPFICMNIIAFAHLTQDVLMQSERFFFLVKSTIQFIENLKSSIQCWNRIPSYAENESQSSTGIFMVPLSLSAYLTTNILALVVEGG